MATQKRSREYDLNLQPPINMSTLRPYYHASHDGSTGGSQRTKRHQPSFPGYTPISSCTSNRFIMQPTSAPQNPYGAFPSLLLHQNGSGLSAQDPSPWTHLQSWEYQMSCDITHFGNQQWLDLEMGFPTGTVPPDITDESALSNLSWSGIHTPAGGELDYGGALGNGQDDSRATEGLPWRDDLTGYDSSFQNVDWENLAYHGNSKLFHMQVNPASSS